MAHDISENSLKSVQSGLTELTNTLNTLANRPPPTMPEIKDRSISGNKIDGGTITRFQSSGIKDESSRLIVLVNNNGLVTDNIDVENLVGDTNVLGNLNVNGSITVNELFVKKIETEIVNERVNNVEFADNEADSIHNKGIIWKGNDYTKQLVYKGDNPRIWTSEHIDLHQKSSFMINGTPVLSKNKLGSSIKESALTKLGVIQNLSTVGDLNVDNHFYYSSAFNRLGLGTDQPSGNFTIAGSNSEFVIDEDNLGHKIGTYSSNDLYIITDDTTRLSVSADGHIVFGSKGSDNAKVSIFGRLGIGINNVSSDVSLDVAGPIKAQGKKFEVGTSYPVDGYYNTGDIIWNSNPMPGTFVGWVCIKEGTPGQWKTFGPVSR